MNPTRQCGKTDLLLPPIGVGCFAFGGGAYWGEQSQQDVDAVVSRALELNLNLFDTAEVYNDGASEVSLGKALAGRRDGAIIVSKVQPACAYRHTLRGRCEASLRRLNTDRIDIYMLHWPLNPQSLRHYTDDPALLRNPPTITETLEAMDELQREGKIRHIAVSNFGLSQMREALAVGVPIAINEVAYSLLMRAAEAEVLPYCVQQGVGVFGYMPLCQGLLSGKFRTLDELPPMRARLRHFSGTRPGSRHGEPGVESELMQTIEALRVEAAAHNLELSDLALAWAMNQPGITSVLVGARNLEQIENNARAMRIEIDARLNERLNAITAPLAALLGNSIDYWSPANDSRSF